MNSKELNSLTRNQIRLALERHCSSIGEDCEECKIKLFEIWEHISYNEAKKINA